MFGFHHLRKRSKLFFGKPSVHWYMWVGFNHYCFKSYSSCSEQEAKGTRTSEPAAMEVNSPPASFSFDENRIGDEENLELYESGVDMEITGGSSVYPSSVSFGGSVSMTVCLLTSGGWFQNVCQVETNCVNCQWFVRCTRSISVEETSSFCMFVLL